MDEHLFPSRRPDWQAHGACRGSGGRGGNYWFPLRGEGTRTPKLIETCNTCPVQMRCLEHALVANEPCGVWGGTSENKRRFLRRRLNLLDENTSRDVVVNGRLSEKAMGKLIDVLAETDTSARPRPKRRTPVREAFPARRTPIEEAS